MQGQGTQSHGQPSAPGVAQGRHDGPERRRVIYSEASDVHWPQAAQMLWASHGWRPVYWIGSRNIEPERDEYPAVIRGRFPGVIVHDSFDAVKGIWPREIAHLPHPPLDEPLLRALAVAEVAALRMMDRMDPDRRSFTHGERVLHFQRLVRGWLAVLEFVRPDLIVFPTAPHLVADYVLYEVAQQAGVETLILERTWTPGMLLSMRRFEEGSVALRSAYAALLAGRPSGPARLTPAAEEELSRLRSDHEAAMTTIHRYRLDPRRGRSLPRRLAGRLVRALRRASHPGRDLRALLHGTALSYVKVRGRALENSRPGAVRLAYLRWAGNRAKGHLARAYAAASLRDAPVDGPFVYLPLHYQPERTTSPLGGVFVDLEHVVRLVAAALPDGWHVVVREHPLIFQRNTRGHLARTPRFYQDLADIPGVVFARMNQDPFELLDRSTVVATVTGTTGWEAVVRGTPVLLFGYPWYRDCDGIIEVRSTSDVRQALAAVTAGYRPDPERVRLFAEAVESIAVPGYNDSILARLAGMPDVDNATALAAALLSAAGEKVVDAS